VVFSVSSYVLSECRGDGINVAYCIYLCYLVRFWNFAKLFPWLLVFCLGNIYLVRLQFCMIFLVRYVIISM